MASYWGKARRALGLHHVDHTSNQYPEPASSYKQTTAADHAFLCGEADHLSNSSCDSMHTGTVSPIFSPKFFSKLHFNRRNSLRSPRSAGMTTCAICLEIMTAGEGHALFTAECSHSFHFSCIASNVRFGNLICPVCRATWKDVPWQAPPPLPSSTTHPPIDMEPRPQPQRNSSLGRGRCCMDVDGHCEEQMMLEALKNAEEEQRRLEPVLEMLEQSIASSRLTEERKKQSGEPEPSRFDDDEELETAYCIDEDGSIMSVCPSSSQAMQIRVMAEEGEVPCSEACAKLTVLVHIKGISPSVDQQFPNMMDTSVPRLDGVARRAPVDLVAVLDVSGSMAGNKLVLLKGAMRLVVRSLGAADRLCVVAFSLTARRVMPLRRMSVEGRRAALQVLDSLTCTGGTSIADGLRKGVAVLHQRRHQNPVASIILLSDGQDSFTMRSPTAQSQDANGYGQFPVHTFGLGADHDAVELHEISEQSGGTFSFIQAEGLVQDAFAQCIGGLLSVVALRVEVEVQVANPAVSQLHSLETGSYVCETVAAGRHARVRLGDLYADEERDILVNISLPAMLNDSDNHISPPESTLYVHALYTDPLSRCSTQTADIHFLIRRPSQISNTDVPRCIDVDRHRNRLHAAHAIVEARTFADAGDFPSAQRCLDMARQRLQSSAALHRGDKLSMELETELLRIQRSMSNRLAYVQTCGRAYALSVQSCHLRQRATTRGGSSGTEEAEGYRTPSMNSLVLFSRRLAERSTPPPPVPPPPSAVRRANRRRHILQPRPGSQLARVASFDSVVRP